MHVAVVHNAVSEDAGPDERDVLVQADVVLRALESLGRRASVVPCTLDLESIRTELGRLQPDVVFNLVEALGGSDRLQTLFPALLDAVGIPYTGVPTESFLIASHKLLAKERLRRAGLPTADWAIGTGSRHRWALPDMRPLAPPFIVKSVFEHASFGMDDEAVVSSEGRPAEEVIDERTRRFGREFFAERFIAGREFNLSLLAGPDGPEALPPAEIDFSTFPEGKPRIVGYAAKWAEGSFEFDQTPRRFEFAEADAGLLAELRSLAIRAWRAFGLRGYARVDFRVDNQGQPWILEINGNPCLSPDAGFAAALARAGIRFPEAVSRILTDARVPRS